MCQISKKTQFELKLLAFLLLVFPFAYMSSVMLARGDCGWWLAISSGLVTCPLIIWGDKCKRKRQ